MFLHPEHVLREQRRRHNELVSEMAAERQAAAARPSHHRFLTMARWVRTYASARLWRHIISAPFTGHRGPAPPSAPRRMAPMTPPDTPRVVATTPTVVGRTGE